MQTEPVALISAITRVIETIIMCAVLFGLDWTAEQQAAVLAIVIAIGGMVQTVFTRKQVVPYAKARERERVLEGRLSLQRAANDL